MEQLRFTYLTFLITIFIRNVPRETLHIKKGRKERLYDLIFQR